MKTEKHKKIFRSIINIVGTLAAFIYSIDLILNDNITSGILAILTLLLVRDENNAV